ncbi:DUF4386 domain-containing protein [Microbacterium sp. EST19A]|uniref:DUF4386 domain-containing protein n=1 Tax=Microbacterium sp. EST19A TaxID=2862681 RepID=UPI001CBCA6FF|nr:DUF4386 domain-containing protein [Microbacterium sp. EST19A]
MNPSRRTALLAGILYLLTVATSIPALALKEPVLTDPALLDAGGGPALSAAAALEVVMAVACVGTAVVLYPVLRRVSDGAALGFVAARIVEAGLVMAGVIGMLSLTALPTEERTGTLADVLRAVHDSAFLFGPGLIPAVNGLLLGYVLLRARLVPRVLPVLAFIGAPLLVTSAGATLFGAVDQVSGLAGAAALPIAAWEIGLGLWLTFRGFPRDVPEYDLATR